ncbi:MAG: uracil phosphoribosyltransferase [Flavobacteriaceae bacterium]|nr:uracil phosphoribosyltransferase [Flavobacteriaceae bacterium]
MQIHDFSDKSSVLNTFVSEIRSITIQKDRMRFRRNIERVGEILSYEMSKTLSSDFISVETPLGKSDINLPKNDIVICSILRAGLPFHNGILNYFDKAENAFISAYRHHLNSKDFEIIVEYIASPNLENKTLVLVDPMLATGQSLALTYEALKSHGTPKQIHLLSVIGAKTGVDYIKDKFPKNTHLWIAAIDDNLNDKGYIVPGLGDAGDLAFGPKLKN